jgi:hypothetical protein
VILAQIGVVLNKAWRKEGFVFAKKTHELLQSNGVTHGLLDLNI